MTHKLIEPIKNPSQTNITNILTMSEAAYRWGIVENDIKTRLRTKGASEAKMNELRYLEAIGYLKYFKPFEERDGKKARGTWLLSVEIMTLWFGEPVILERVKAL